MTYEQNVRTILETVFTESKDELIEIAVNSIMKLNQYGEWIPTNKENNPKADGFYIATMDGEICGEPEPIVGLAEFVNGEWVDDEDDYKCILAWTPLPNAYQPTTE